MTKQGNKIASAQQTKKTQTLSLETGLAIMAGQWTMSGLIGELTSQPFVLPVMLTSHIRSY